MFLTKITPKPAIALFLLFAIFISFFGCTETVDTPTTDFESSFHTATESNIESSEFSDDTTSACTTELQETLAPEPILDIEHIALNYSNGNCVENTVYSVSDNGIRISVPYSVKESKLKDLAPVFSGDELSLICITDSDGNAVEKTDFGKEYAVKLKSKEIIFELPLIIVRDNKNLPIISLYTDSGEEIDSKFDYVHGYLTIDTEGSAEYAGHSRKKLPLNVRGRGNASWRMSPKKSYRIKLDNKESILGLDANRDWVLVPNYYDKSLIRNAVAHKMAEQMEHLYYNPTHIMIDLFINGKYMGVYSVSDKIEVSEEKVCIGNTTGVKDPGFFIEIGWDYDEKLYYGKDYFDTDLLYRLFVKEPEIEKRYSPEMNYIIDYIEKTENAIVNLDGYDNYIDVAAFVDWFIIAELTNNTEMAFYRSCYFYKPEGGKLIMGPVWDFDMAFGNHTGDVKNYDKWATAEATYHEIGINWASYLIKDKVFMNKVKARWEQKGEILLKTALDAIDEYSTQVSESQAENFKVWDIMDKRVGLGRVDPKKYNTYEKQVEYLREFVTKRASWIDSELQM